jgi:hypothetical protein
MKSTGKTLALLALLALSVSVNTARSAVTANLDRNQVSLGDTLRLTLSASDGEDFNDAALQPLLEDFEIMRRSTSSNTSLVNGRLSRSRQMIVDISPRREGDLRIPSMDFEGSNTNTLSVTVGPMPDGQSDDQPVIFEAEIDQNSVYVQGQIILTLRVQQAVNLEGRNISELKLDNAFVKPLEQRSFQRTIDGRPWLVDEVRYAVFPEQSGTLEIPAQTFSGRLRQGRRSFFDLGSSGSLLRRTTDPISIKVLPRPAGFTANTWLPSESVTLKETWSTPPDQLRAGESATRTIEILGEGLQGAQLPPIIYPPTDGLKFYPDQPQISEQEIPSGLLGIRRDSAAIVPTRPGTYLIPEIRVPWWDTKTEQVEYAVIPEREITVAAAETSGNIYPEPIAQGAQELSPTGPISTTTPSFEQNLSIWQTVSVVSTLGWLITLIFLWRQRPSKRQPAAPSPSVNTSEKICFKQLLTACQAGDPTSARHAVIEWAAALKPEARPTSLEQISRLFDATEFSGELQQLDSLLYSPDRGGWSGSGLAASAKALRSEQLKRKRGETTDIRLYPEG